MAAVDQDEKLNSGSPALVEERVERGADGAAGVEHVVHQDDVFAFDGKRDVGGVDDGLVGDGGEVVAVEVDIQNAHGDLALLEALDFLGEALGERDASAANAD